MSVPILIMKTTMSKIIHNFPRVSLIFLFVLILLIITSICKVESILQDQEQGDILNREPCELLSLPKNKFSGCDLKDIIRTSSNVKLPVSSLLLSADRNSIRRVKDIRDTGFIPPGRKIAPWPLVLPLNWAEDPFEDRNWQFHVHAWRMIDPMLAAWNGTGDPDHLNYAWEIISDWYNFHFVQKKKSSMQWYDMSVGLRATKLAYIIRMVAEEKLEVDYEGYRVLLILAHEHARYLMDPAELSSGNHALFQLHGLMALCKIVPYLNACDGYEKYIEISFTDLLSRQFNEEGVHLENSPGYHFMAYRVVEKILNSGWYNEFSDVGNLMDKAFLNQAYMVFPDKTIVTVGDSEAKKSSIQFPIGDDRCIKEFKTEDNCYFSRSFSEAGYAVVRSDWAIAKENSSMLFFMGMFHSNVHKLPDDLSFEWFDHGHRILTNAGKYSYEKNKFRSFVQSTRAHNTVEINQSNFSTKAKYAYGSALKAISMDNGVFKIIGEVDHSSLSTRHYRTIYYQPRKWLAVVDELTSDSTNKYTQWFHFDPSFNLSGEEGCRVIGESEDGKIRAFIRHYSDRCDFQIIRGQTEPIIQGWVTSSYGKVKERFSLGFFKRGKGKQRLITIFGFSVDELINAENYLIYQGMAF